MRQRRLSYHVDAKSNETKQVLYQHDTEDNETYNVTRDIKNNGSFEGRDRQYH